MLLSISFKDLVNRRRNRCLSILLLFSVTLNHSQSLILCINHILKSKGLSNGNEALMSRHYSPVIAHYQIRGISRWLVVNCSKS